MIWLALDSFFAGACLATTVFMLQERLYLVAVLNLLVRVVNVFLAMSRLLDRGTG